MASTSDQQLCQLYSLADIQSATKNFDDGLVIGSGGFGKVYEGHINGSSTSVAIKRLDSMSDQGAPEFRAEIETLSKLRHAHLVSLLGCCDDDKEMILVYEYMPNGTVNHHLHKSDAPLSWMQRLRIGVGAARGLDYLHTGVGTRHGIIHRDVKSSNILLDEDMEAKISDFGLAKLCPINQISTSVNTGIKGTHGYLDPEVAMTGKFTRKTDVFAFGVVLFELLSGRDAVLPEGDEYLTLARWSQNCVKEKKFDQLVATGIRGTLSPKSLKEFAQIAYRCLHFDPNQRPTMSEVVVKLQFSVALQVKFENYAKPAGLFGFSLNMLNYGFRPKKEKSVSVHAKDGIDDKKAQTTMIPLENRKKQVSGDVVVSNAASTWPSWIFTVPGRAINRNPEELKEAALFSRDGRKSRYQLRKEEESKHACTSVSTRVHKPQRAFKASHVLARVLLETDQWKQGNKRPSSSVVARLMGLEALKPSIDESKTSKTSTCLDELSVSNSKSSRKEEESKQDCTSVSTRVHKPQRPVKASHVLARIPLEMAPWKQEGGGWVPQNPLFKCDEGPPLAEPWSIYDEIVKQLTDLRALKASGKDLRLRALEQILEAKQIREAMHNINMLSQKVEQPVSPTTTQQKVKHGRIRLKDSNVRDRKATVIQLSTSNFLEKINNLVHQIELNTSNYDANINHTVTSSCEDETRDHRYVEEIILASGCLRDLDCTTAIVQLHPTTNIINPELFHVLEKTKTSTMLKDDRYNKKLMISKVRSKLVFDTVNDVLGHKLSMIGTLGPYKGRIFNADWLLTELCTGIDSLQNKSDVSYEDEQVINIINADVNKRSQDWDEYRYQVQGLVLDIELLILDDFICEAVNGQVTSLQDCPVRPHCRQLIPI